MNAVWNSYGQLCGCPEIFKKSCKFFCRELDIRVPNIKKNSDVLSIETEKGQGTKVTMIIYIREDKNT